MQNQYSLMFNERFLMVARKWVERGYMYLKKPMYICVNQRNDKKDGVFNLIDFLTMLYVRGFFFIYIEKNYNETNRKL